MAELSRHLNSNPTDLAYALGKTSKYLAFATGEWYEVVVLLNTLPVYSSGQLRIESLRNLDAQVKVSKRPRDRVRIKLYVTKYRQGFPYQAAYPLPSSLSSPVKGASLIVIRGSAVQSSRAMRQSRSRRVGFGSRTYVQKGPFPRSSTLRPSPQSFNRPFLKTEESEGPGVPYGKTSVIIPDLIFFRTWSGSRTPGWGKKKKKAYVDNAHTAVLVQREENRYSWYQVQPATGAYYLNITLFTDSYLGALTPPLDHVSTAEFNALNRLIANAQMGIQSNLAQNIAQVNQLSQLIIGNAMTMAGSLRQLKRGNLAAAANAFRSGRGSQPSFGQLSTKKSLASNWLALQYGWKPLLQDIEGFLQVMANQTVPQDFVQKVRGSAKVQRTIEIPFTGHMSIKGTVVWKYQTQCKFVIRYRMDNPLLALFAQTGFTNPVALAWELLPFSFVADWFLPIGKYLEAFTAWQGATFLSGSKTLFTRRMADASLAYSGPHLAEPTVTVHHFANFRDNTVSLNRSVLGNFPSPVVPVVNSGTGILGGTNTLAGTAIGEHVSLPSRALNAIALLTGFLK